MRLALYARVSTDRQNRDQTIDSQVSALRRWAAEHDHTVRPEHVFTDDGYSGSRLDRPALDRLRDAAREGEFDGIAVYSPDRLARRYAYQVVLLEEFRKAGCRVEFVHRPITDDPHDQLLLQIQGAVAEYERAVLGERFRRGKLQKARAGQWVAGKAPYGYRYVAKRDGVPGHLVIDDDEATIVRMLYRWLIDERMTVRQILKRLAAGPWRPRNGNRLWSSAVVHRVLSDPVYVGTGYVNRHVFVTPRKSRMTGPRVGERTCRQPRPKAEWIAIPVPAVIDDATRRQAADQLARNSLLSFRRNTRHHYLLRCLLTCRSCGLAMFGITKEAKGKTPHAYYQCHGKDCVARGREHRCPQTPAKVAELDAAVWDHVRKLLDDPATLIARFEAFAAATDPSAAPPEDAQLCRLDREEQRLVDAYQAEAIALAELRDRRQQIASRRQTLKTQREQRERLRAERHTAQTVWKDLAAFCERIRARLGEATLAEKQQVLQLLIERVIVGEDSLEIRHVIPLRGPQQTGTGSEPTGDLGSHGKMGNRDAGESRLRSDGVGPAELAAFDGEVVVDGVAVGGEDAVRGRPEVVEGDASAGGADQEGGGRGGPGDPQPDSFCPLFPAGFVDVRVRPLRGRERRGVERGQGDGGLAFELADHAQGQRDVAEVGEELADRPLAEPADAGEVGDGGLESRAEPAGGVGPRRRGRRGPTTGASQRVPAVVNHVAEFHGQLDDLIDHRIRVVAGERGVTAVTLRRLVVADLVRGQDRPLAFGMAGLAATFAARRPLRRGRLDGRPVRRRRLRRVPGILIQPGFQLRDLRFQLRHPRKQQPHHRSRLRRPRRHHLVGHFDPHSAVMAERPGMRKGYWERCERLPPHDIYPPYMYRVAARYCFRTDSYRKHKQSGQAIVTIPIPGTGRKEITLGRYGSVESKAEYRRLCATLDANDGQFPNSWGRVNRQRSAPSLHPSR